MAIKFRLFARTKKVFTKRIRFRFVYKCDDVDMPSTTTMMIKMIKMRIMMMKMKMILLLQMMMMTIMLMMMTSI